MENTSLRQDADAIISAAISAVQPDAAVQRALSGMSFDGKVVLIAIGKAAWQMAKAASDVLGYKIDNGVVVTSQFQMRIHLKEHRQQSMQLRI